MAFDVQIPADATEFLRAYDLTSANFRPLGGTIAVSVERKRIAKWNDWTLWFTGWSRLPEYVYFLGNLTARSSTLRHVKEQCEKTCLTLCVASRSN